MVSRSELSRAFALSFYLNLGWELLHAPFYSSLPDGLGWKLLICAAASFADAIYVTAACVAAKHIPGKQQIPFLIAAGLTVAAGVEILALNQGIWQYAAVMPLVPLLRVGLS